MSSRCRSRRRSKQTRGRSRRGSGFRTVSGCSFHEIRKDFARQSGATQGIFIEFDGFLCYLLRHPTVVTSLESVHLRPPIGLPFQQLIYLAELFLLKLQQRNFPFRFLIVETHARCWQECPSAQLFRMILLRHLKSLKLREDDDSIIVEKEEEEEEGELILRSRAQDKIRFDHLPNFDDENLSPYFAVESPYVFLLSRVFKDELPHPRFDALPMNRFFEKLCLALPSSDIFTFSEIVFTSNSASGYSWNAFGKILPPANVVTLPDAGPIVLESREKGGEDEEDGSSLFFDPESNLGTRLRVLSAALRLVLKKHSESHQTLPLAEAHVLLVSARLMCELSFLDRCLNLRELLGSPAQKEVQKLNAFLETVFSLVDVSPQTVRDETWMEMLDFLDCRLYLCLWLLLRQGRGLELLLQEKEVQFTSSLLRVRVEEVKTAIRDASSSQSRLQVMNELPPAPLVRGPSVSRLPSTSFSFSEARRKASECSGLCSIKNPLLDRVLPEFSKLPDRGEVVPGLLESDRQQQEFMESYHWSVIARLSGFERQSLEQKSRQQHQYRMMMESAKRYVESLSVFKKKKLLRWEDDLEVLEDVVTLLKEQTYEADSVCVNNLLKLFTENGRPVENVLLCSLFFRANREGMALSGVEEEEGEGEVSEEEDEPDDPSEFDVLNQRKWRVFHSLVMLKKLQDLGRRRRSRAQKYRGKRAEKTFRSITEMYNKRADPRKIALGLERLQDSLDSSDSDFDGIVFQLRHRERFETIQDQIELNEISDYCNREDFQVYKKKIGFIPDPWQKTLIDVIKTRRSAVVAAPTSSGKTFLAFYCIDRVLKGLDGCSPNGVVVFVSPINALINQVFAECYARFSNDKSTAALGGMNPVGKFTALERLWPLDCRVLVTNAECLRHLLLSPHESSHEWRQRIQYVIFDEVHTINDQGKGSVWEHLLVLLRKPFLALSATIGNPTEFVAWLNSHHQRKEQDLVELICDDTRPCDLTYHLFNEVAADEEDDDRTSPFPCIHPLGLVNELAPVSRILHEIDHSKHLTGAQLLELYEVIAELFADLVVELDPSKFFHGHDMEYISRRELRAYDASLREVLKKIAVTEPETFCLVIQRIRNPNSFDHFPKVAIKSGFELLGPLQRILLGLKAQSDLPAIVFHFSRPGCEALVRKLGEALVLCDETLFNEEFLSEQEMDLIEREIHASVERLREWKACDEALLECLCQGIAVHHGGMDTRYRHEVEILFREKLLPVVIATGTLSHGINMPVKTVVLLGDSMWLTPSLFSQTTGRAGRRGLDTSGRVVLVGIPLIRCRRLMLSEEVKISGQMGITTSLLLRFLILLRRRPEFLDDVCRLLCTPLTSIVRNDAVAIDQVKHHVRLSFEFLVRQGYISQKGSPINFAGLCSHLFHAEPSNFVFLQLLKTGTLHRLEQACQSTELFRDLLFKLLCLFFCGKEVTEKTAIQAPELALPPLSEMLKSAGAGSMMPEMDAQMEQYRRLCVNVVGSYLRSLGSSFQEQDDEREIEEVQEEEREYGLRGSLIQSCVLPFSELSCAPEVHGQPEDESSSLRKIIHQFRNSLRTCSVFAGLSGHSDDSVLCSLPLMLASLRADIDLVEPALPFPRGMIRRERVSSYLWSIYSYEHKDEPSFDFLSEIAVDHRTTHQLLSHDALRFRKIMRKIDTSLRLLVDESSTSSSSGSFLSEDDPIVAAIHAICEHFDVQFRGGPGTVGGRQVYRRKRPVFRRQAGGGARPRPGVSEVIRKNPRARRRHASQKERQVARSLRRKKRRGDLNFVDLTEDQEDLDDD